MSSDPHASRVLPFNANLEQQKKQARELLRAALSHEPAALQRFSEHHPRLRGRTPQELAGVPFALHERNWCSRANTGSRAGLR
jgi:hypothetical protein